MLKAVYVEDADETEDVALEALRLELRRGRRRGGRVGGWRRLRTTSVRPVLVSISTIAFGANRAIEFVNDSIAFASGNNRISRVIFKK